jgi:hypothetical protein
MRHQIACTVAAMLLGATITPAMGQATTPSTNPPAASPATPPTHPTMRENPTTSPGQSMSGSPQRKKAGSIDEAKQACKNLTGEQAQRDCLKKAEDDFKNSKTSQTKSPQ